MKLKLLEPIKGFEEVAELVVDLAAGDWYLTVASGRYAPCQAVTERYGSHIRLTKVKRTRIEFTEVDTFEEATTTTVFGTEFAYYLRDDGEVELGKKDELIEGKWLRKNFRTVTE